MMTRRPTTRTLIADLTQRGWRAVRTKGSHQTWQSPDGANLTLTVHHLARPASPTVLAAYRRAVGEDPR